jgi:hypothetical protein
VEFSLITVVLVYKIVQDVQCHHARNRTGAYPMPQKVRLASSDL